MNKRIVKLLCFIIFAFLSANFIIIPIMSNETVNIVLNGEELTFDVSPQIIDNRTLVPIRGILEALGANVDWDNYTQTITATKDDTVITMQINNVIMLINGEESVLDVPPQLVNDRTLAPVRAAAESLNASVEWNNDTRTVVITTATPPTRRPARDPSTGAILGYDDDGIAELQFNARHLFEQTILPAEVFAYADWVAERIKHSNTDAIKEFIFEIWELAVANVMLDDMIFSGGERPVTANEWWAFWEHVDENRIQLYLTDDHIVNVAVEEFNVNTTAVIIDLLNTNLALLSTHIGIAYNEIMGLRFFTLERSLGFLEDGIIPYMFCFITADSRGTISVIENDRQAFIDAIGSIMLP